MQLRSAFQIATGPGAGNIGEDLAMQGFWRQIPEDFRLHAGGLDNYRRQRDPYPARFTYHVQSPGPIENARVRDIPGTFAGSIFERPGSGWPLAFIASSISTITVSPWTRLASMSSPR